MKIPELLFTAKHPFFFYSETEIEATVKNAQAFWSQWSLPGFETFYSVKVNPNPHLLKVMSKHVQGFDVSSLSEARLVRQWFSSATETQVTWSGPAKTNHALDEVLALNLHCIHLDSTDEWLEIARRNPNAKYSLRISTTEIHAQKLGFSKAELARLRTLTQKAWPAVHSYLGRETFSQTTMALFEERVQSAINEGFLADAPEVYLGAGLPSRKLLSAHEPELKPQSLPSRILNLEAGRALIQSAGWYGTQILSLKSTAEKKNAIINGGLQHLASHFQSPRYKAENVEVRFFRNGQELTDRSDVLSLQGSLSLWHDVMIENISAPAGLRRGDWIVANHVGAYGYSTASNQFLGPSKITEWLLHQDGRLQDISARDLRSYHEATR